MFSFSNFGSEMGLSRTHHFWSFSLACYACVQHMGRHICEPAIRYFLQKKLKVKHTQAGKLRSLDRKFCEPVIGTHKL